MSDSVLRARAGLQPGLDPGLSAADLVACDACGAEDLRQLLRAGLDPCSRDATGRSMVHHAAMNARPDLLQLLIDHGADPADAGADPGADPTPLELVELALADGRALEPPLVRLVGGPSAEELRQRFEECARLLRAMGCPGL